MSKNPRAFVLIDIADETCLLRYLRIQREEIDQRIVRIEEQLRAKWNGTKREELEWHIADRTTIDRLISNLWVCLNDDAEI